MVEQSGPLTLARFLRDVYAPHTLDGYAPAWRENARLHIDSLADSSLGPRLLTEIRPIHVASWWNAQKRHPRQANMLRQRLRHAFKYAAALELMTGDPAKHLAKVRENEGRIRYLTDDERARVLAEAARTNPRIYRYILTAINTLGRRASLVRLLERDVDLERGVIVFRRTKTGKDVEVPIASPTFRAELARWLTGRREAPLLHQYPNPYAITLGFRRVCLRAGVKDFRFHDLRHDTATRLVNAGTDPLVLKALGGWSTMTMVARYAHPGDRVKREAMERALG